MKLVIEIELGNDRMLSGQDAVDALVRNRLNAHDPSAMQASERGYIRDVNGNRVGEWKVEE